MIEALISKSTTVKLSKEGISAVSTKDTDGMTYMKDLSRGHTEG